jgi:hypothetical protein
MKRSILSKINKIKKVFKDIFLYDLVEETGYLCGGFCYEIVEEQTGDVFCR